MQFRNRMDAFARLHRCETLELPITKSQRDGMGLCARECLRSSPKMKRTKQRECAWVWCLQNERPLIVTFHNIWYAFALYFINETMKRVLETNFSKGEWVRKRCMHSSLRSNRVRPWTAWIARCSIPIVANISSRMEEASRAYQICQDRCTTNSSWVSQLAQCATLHIRISLNSSFA